VCDHGRLLRLALTSTTASMGLLWYERDCLPPKGLVEEAQTTTPLGRVVSMLEFIDRVMALVATALSWFIGQPLLVQVLVGAAALAMLWFLWIVLRVTLVAFRTAFRGL
jgi:hypothetical protein